LVWENFVIPVILSGGSGSRLWPVSRQSHPKQFSELLDESLFVKTLKRLMPLGSPWTVTVEELKVLTERALRENQVPLNQAIYEPSGKNTAMAIAVLCRVLELRGFAESVVGVFPADHLIEDEDAFRSAVRLGEKLAAQGHVVTLGIKPNCPATGYGYIETSGRVGDVALKAIGFREKPSEATARGFLARGGFYWNAGMFIFKASTMNELLRTHTPDIWNLVADLKSDLSGLAEIYKRARSISIDYAVMERLDSHVCIPCSFGWSDLGSWDALSEVMPVPTTQVKSTVEVAAKSNFVFPVEGKTYAFVGVDDLIVVDTFDALLIARKGQTELVKEVVDTLKAQSNVHATQHPFEVRPWGRFKVLHDSAMFKSKTILVDSGAQISYQSHQKRTEYWIILRGRGEVTLDGEIIPVEPGKHVHVPMGMKHRIRNTGDAPLEFVEVQLGTYFGEDDIVRYEDVYNRQ
jgi:mannose-1-phosphate guanylyltransferase/mannose-6-phosphate isomerase